MFKIYILFLLSFFINLIIPISLAEKNEVINKSISPKELDWEYSDLNTQKKLNWDEVVNYQGDKMSHVCAMCKYVPIEPLECV